MGTSTEYHQRRDNPEHPKKQPIPPVESSEDSAVHRLHPDSEERLVTSLVAALRKVQHDDEAREKAVKSAADYEREQLRTGWERWWPILKWASVVVAGAFVAGGGSYLWLYENATKTDLEDRVKPLEEKVGAIAATQHDIKTGVDKLVQAEKTRGEATRSQVRCQAYRDEYGQRVQDWIDSGKRPGKRPNKPEPLIECEAQ